MRNIANKLSGVLSSIAAFSFLAGCDKIYEKPVPISIDALPTTSSNNLIGHSVLFDATVKFQREINSRRWVQPGPILIPMGKSRIAVAQVGHEVIDVNYVYDVTVSGKSGDKTWHNVKIGKKVADGPTKVIAVFKGVDAKGAIQLSSFEFINTSDKK